MSSVPCSTSLLSFANAPLLSTNDRTLAGAPFERQGKKGSRGPARIRGFYARVVAQWLRKRAGEIGSPYGVTRYLSPAMRRCGRAFYELVDVVYRRRLTDRPVRRPPTTERRRSFRPQRRDPVNVRGTIRGSEDRHHQDDREREQGARPRPRVQRLHLIELGLQRTGTHPAERR